MKRDLGKAFEYFKLASESEEPYAAAMYNLGNCYFYGRGVKRDLQQAFFWNKKAAVAGDLWAMNQLAVVDYGVEISDAERIMWLKKAADLNDDTALYNLALRYLNGYDGIESDEKMAVKLFRKSAKQDHPSAYYALYKCYTNGRGVRKNCQLALKYLHKSAKLGYPKARKVLKKLEETQNEQ